MGGGIAKLRTPEKCEEVTLNVLDRKTERELVRAARRA